MFRAVVVCMLYTSIAYITLAAFEYHLWISYLYFAFPFVVYSSLFVGSLFLLVLVVFDEWDPSMLVLSFSFKQHPLVTAPFE